MPVLGIQRSGFEGLLDFFPVFQNQRETLQDFFLGFFRGVAHRRNAEGSVLCGAVSGSELYVEQGSGGSNEVRPGDAFRQVDRADGGAFKAGFCQEGETVFFGPFSVQTGQVLVAFKSPVAFGLHFFQTGSKTVECEIGYGHWGLRPLSAGGPFDQVQDVAPVWDGFCELDGPVRDDHDGADGRNGKVFLQAPEVVVWTEFVDACVHGTGDAYTVNCDEGFRVLFPCAGGERFDREASRQLRFHCG